MIADLDEPVAAHELHAVTLASILDGVIVTDAAGIVRFVNEAAARMIECAVADAVGVPLHDVFRLIDATSRAPLPDFPAGAVQSALLTGLRGHEVPVGVRTVRLGADGGAIRGTVLTFRDNTERQRYEAALIRANERYVIASDAAGVGFWEYDVVAGTLQWDDWMYRLYGREPQDSDPPYSLWATSLHPEDRDGAEREVGEAIAKGRAYESEFRIVLPDGEIRHLKVWCGVKAGADGRSVRLFGINVDITERQRAGDLQRRMAALVDSADDAILTKTLDGVISSWNPGAERLLGYRADEIIGQPITRLLPADRQDEEAMIVAQIMQGHHVAHFETMRQRKDGSQVDVSLTISPILDRNGAIVGSSKIMRDVSERIRYVDQLRRVNEELETRIRARTEELREREILLQEIHHRVKNNLQVISSLINMQARVIGDLATREALQQCRSRVEAMAQIHEMLYLAKDYARVPFWRYARELTTRVLGASGKMRTDITLAFDLDELSLPVDKAIPCGLILNELVSNALKHAFPQATEGTISVGLRAPGDGSVRLSVGDNGVGMSSTFDPQTSRSLGMQLVNTLVAQLDGRLDIVRDGGTTFRFAFPLEPKP